MRFTNVAVLIVVVICSSSLEGRAGRSASAGSMGPLRVHPKNRRYFQNSATGKVVYLTGSHTWSNLVDMGPKDPSLGDRPPKFDFDAYLGWMAELNHNFIRLWTLESATWNETVNNEDKIHTCSPHPWARTGAGEALDGRRKFDLSKFNPEYFGRLRKRVGAAQKRGIYVSVMLFEGWGLQFSKGAWEGHPFNPKNNVNGIDGDTNKDGKGIEIHTLGNKSVTAIQEAYVRKVIDTVGGFDNVLYEISNENHSASTQWQYHIIRFIKEYEKGKAQQHPVGMTYQYRGGKNEDLFKSPADWVSPNNEGGYRDDPPAADGRKVVLNDTDHLWGIGGNKEWVWKSFARGHNPIFMDPYNEDAPGSKLDRKWESIREAMGHARHLSMKISLVDMPPRPGLASTKYCLANPGKEYFVYRPSGADGSVMLQLMPGDYKYRWLNADDFESVSTGIVKVTTGDSQEFKSPLEGHGLLCLYRIENLR